MKVPEFDESLRVLLNHIYSEGRVEVVQEFDPVEQMLGETLPANFKAFLMETDGGETKEPLDHYRFYPLSELVERFQDVHPPKCLPFATDDSLEFAFDLRRNRASASYEVISYPDASDDPSDVEWVAKDFAEFLWLITRSIGRSRDL